MIMSLLCDQSCARGAKCIGDYGETAIFYSVNNATYTFQHIKLVGAVINRGLCLSHWEDIRVVVNLLIDLKLYQIKVDVDTKLVIISIKCLCNCISTLVKTHYKNRIFKYE